jgi:hypothetical protein
MVGGGGGGGGGGGRSAGVIVSFIVRPGRAGSDGTEARLSGCSFEGSVFSPCGRNT